MYLAPPSLEGVNRGRFTFPLLRMDDALRTIPVGTQRVQWRCIASMKVLFGQKFGFQTETEHVVNKGLGIVGGMEVRKGNNLMREVNDPGGIHLVEVSYCSPIFCKK